MSGKPCSAVFISVLYFTEIELTNHTVEQSARFIVHGVQVIPQKAFRNHEFYKFVTLPANNKSGFALPVRVCIPFIYCCNLFHFSCVLFTVMQVNRPIHYAKR